MNYLGARELVQAAVHAGRIFLVAAAIALVAGQIRCKRR